MVRRSRLYIVMRFECSECLSDSSGIDRVHDRGKPFIVPEIIAIIGKVRPDIKSWDTYETAVYISTNKKDKPAAATDMNLIMATMVDQTGYPTWSSFQSDGRSFRDTEIQPVKKLV